MKADEKPLSTLVSQGWEIVGYAYNSTYGADQFLLRRQKQHKVLRLTKWFGSGFRAKEIDI